MVKYALKGIIMTISLLVLVGVGASYIGIDFGFITEIFDFAFMMLASFDWIVPFSTVKVVLVSMISLETVLLIIRLYTHLIGNVKN